MTTVREMRIKTAQETIFQQAELYGLSLKDKTRVELVAEHVVDALFPDHTFDNVEVS
jgi:hypothetical protein